MVSLTTDKEQPNVPIHLAKASEGPPVMDVQNPVVNLIIKGCEISGCIINGESGVNVISEGTCRSFGLTQWEPCPFCLRMADTRSVRPLGMIRKHDFVLGGHTFTISAMVLRLEAPSVKSQLLINRPK